MRKKKKEGGSRPLSPPYQSPASMQEEQGIHDLFFSFFCHRPPYFALQPNLSAALPIRTRSSRSSSWLVPLQSSSFFPSPSRCGPPLLQRCIRRPPAPCLLLRSSPLSPSSRLALFASSLHTLLHSH